MPTGDKIVWMNHLLIIGTGIWVCKCSHKGRCTHKPPAQGSGGGSATTSKVHMFPCFCHIIIEEPRRPSTVSCLPTFSDESESGLVLLAEAAAKWKGEAAKAQPLNTMVTCHLQPHDPTAKLPGKLVRRIENLRVLRNGGDAARDLGFTHPLTAGHYHASQRGPVTDILIWCKCYDLMAAVLTKTFPSEGPELLAYQKRVVHASCNFEGATWVAYDYRRQALSNQSLDWSAEDPSLYNEPSWATQS